VNKSISAIYQKLDESDDEETLNESIQAFLLFLPFAKMNFSNDVIKIFIHFFAKNFLFRN